MTIASLLDGTLDDLADLKGFKSPPSGAYRAGILGITEKKIGDHPAVEVKFKHLELLELAETTAKPEEMMNEGDEYSVAYMQDNETGQGFLKELLKALAEKLGTAKISEIVEQSKGMELGLVIKRTYDEKKDRYYTNIKQVSVL